VKFTSCPEQSSVFLQERSLILSRPCKFAKKSLHFTQLRSGFSHNLNPQISRRFRLRILFNDTVGFSIARTLGYALKLTSLSVLQDQIISCCQCNRLTRWREKVAREKRAAYRDQEYWGRPVPGFGDPRARVLICGLAPAAHGGNRTGRIFTGDRSGDWLYAALFRAGFANQPTSQHRNDGLQLKDCYITSCVRCAPPNNKPTPDERDKCLPYLLKEIAMLQRIRAVVCLGSFAWRVMLRGLRQLKYEVVPTPKFGHGVEAIFGPYYLIGSYHPSQQNTFTGRLTETMLDIVFERAKKMSVSKKT